MVFHDIANALNSDLCLNCILYRYAPCLTSEQKDALLDVVRAHPHAQIAPEIRRELKETLTVRGGEGGADADVVMS